MALLQLDVGLFYSAIINACHCVIEQRDALNAINVFPVADGDTGNNMAATAQAIINHAALKSTLTETCQSLANAGILGARGNSGMIFSQFFNGFLEISLPETFNTIDFAKLIKTACESVRAAIINPVEGTIITVMDAWANSLAEKAPQITCFNLLLSSTTDAVDIALTSTMNTLKLLKESQVVDAGALGFSFFIKGFREFLEHPTQERINSEFIFEQDAHEFPSHTTLPTTRYCTEALLSNDALNKLSVTNALQPLGNSMVITANQNLCRVHIHSNRPPDVFTTLFNIGKIQYSKVDDMLRQYQVIHEKKHSIALVTDSSINIPQQLFDEHQAHLIPFNVELDGHHLLDKYCFDNHRIFTILDSLKTYPTTSSPTLALINEKISFLAKHYDHVLIISVAQALSGTYNAMLNAAKHYSNVHVIDSCHVSGSQGLLLNYAAQLINKNYSILEIKEALLEKIAKTYLFIMVNHFDYLIRSGRVSRLKGKLAQYTGLKPIISLDRKGQLIVVDKAFNEVKALSKLVTNVSALINDAGLDNYCIIHAGVPQKAQEFALMTTEAFKKEPLFIEPVSIAIGLHAGKGCMAIAATLN
ncbi:DAK2 domain protein [Legionella beliardensis]|uniref:DAK2 domain protein n=1 Tax=Legionella beliardensis TaxID=91822 RepID=A0A378HXB2_9GAMM|nr:DegV family protein [Legionella beliardensis]STX27558.1 DAK2 domain protein [Legionella beliardensis]